MQYVKNETKIIAGTRTHGYINSHVVYKMLMS